MAIPRKKLNSWWTQSRGAASAFDSNAGTNKGVGTGPGTRKTPSSPPAAKTLGGGVPGTATQPLPPKPTGPPPPSLSGQNLRIKSTEDFGLALGGINRQLLEAAMRYGGVDNIEQYGADDSRYDTNVTKDPNSQFSQIERWLTGSKKTLGQNKNASNTFFSGLHQAESNELGDEAGRDRLAAEAAFKSAMAELRELYGGAKSARDAANRQADLEDIGAAEASAPAPAPMAPDPAPLPAGQDPGIMHQLANMRITGGWVWNRGPDGVWRKVRRM